MCFIINNKQFEFSNTYSVLASQLAKFNHKIALFGSVALTTECEIISYSVVVLQFDLRNMHYYENSNIFLDKYFEHLKMHTTLI